VRADVTVDDPIARFADWWADAHRADPLEPAAMTVASVDDRGRPSARIVLLRGFDARGFVFYTNLESRKGRDLRAHPFAALCFHWKPLQRQVRVEGAVQTVSDAEADAYFAQRARDSQLGAWASRQSEPMQPGELEARIDEARARFAGGSVPRPPHWSGLRVIPDTVEFWSEGAARLHMRERFTREGSSWRRDRLFP
jgi:pyridoxamine 5'-phosphate oxidase